MKAMDVIGPFITQHRETDDKPIHTYVLTPDDGGMFEIVFYDPPTVEQWEALKRFVEWQCSQ